MRYLLVFGSLRKKSKRGYNFNRFGGQKFLRNVTLDGFEMYSLSSYPAVCRGEGKIKCELHSVEKEAAEYIEGMEIGAGYSPEKIKLKNGIEATIYTWPKERLYLFPRVANGDWN